MSGSILDLFIDFLTENSEAERQTMNGLLPKDVKVLLDKELKLLDKMVPRIAVIGKTGVGKSSTVNALFTPKPAVKIGHVVATTKIPQTLTVSLDSERGSIAIVDFPGLGESIQADEEYIRMYKRMLPECDVILWIMKADDRALAEEQRYIKSILSNKLKKRLVIGLNQLDVVQPGQWISQYNTPSQEQEISITIKVQDIKDKLAYIGVSDKAIVPYSALKAYNLTELFKTMLLACPRDRAWLLGKRRKISPYTAPAANQAGIGAT